MGNETNCATNQMAKNPMTVLVKINYFDVHVTTLELHKYMFEVIVKSTK